MIKKGEDTAGKSNLSLKKGQAISVRRAQTVDNSIIMSPISSDIVADYDSDTE